MFQIVGGGDVQIPTWADQLENVDWIGHVPRSAVSAYYQQADVFLFPTISDGFGLTQLEAMAHGLPVIASQRCGDVVRHRENGLRLDRVTPNAIAEALNGCVHHPETLQAFSAEAQSSVAAFSPPSVVDKLIDVVAMHQKA